MKLSSPSTGISSASGALAAALRDPRVTSLARTLRVDLQDPNTLNSLLARTRLALDEPTRVTLSAGPAASEAALPVAAPRVRDTYVRDAIRAYEEVSKLR